MRLHLPTFSSDSTHIKLRLHVNWGISEYPQVPYRNYDWSPGRYDCWNSTLHIFFLRTSECGFRMLNIHRDGVQKFSVQSLRSSLSHHLCTGVVSATHTQERSVSDVIFIVTEWHSWLLTPWISGWLPQARFSTLYSSLPTNLKKMEQVLLIWFHCQWFM